MIAHFGGFYETALHFLEERRRDSAIIAVLGIKRLNIRSRPSKAVALGQNDPPANWNNGVPDSTKIALLNYTTNNPILLSGVAAEALSTYVALNKNFIYLTIQNGGSLTNSDVSVLGLNANVSGIVTVTGANSKWVNTFTNPVGGTPTEAFVVGDAGLGTLNIEAGGTVSVKQEMMLGRQANAWNPKGTVSITGNSLLEVGSLTRGAGDAEVTINGGTIKALANNVDLIKGFTGTEINITGAGLTLDTNGNNVSVSSVLSGSASVSKTGAGTLTLTNAGNSYAGGTIIKEGAIAATSDGQLGTGGITLDGGSFQNIHTERGSVLRPRAVNSAARPRKCICRFLPAHATIRRVHPQACVRSSWRCREIREPRYSRGAHRHHNSGAGSWRGIRRFPVACGISWRWSVAFPLAYSRDGNRRCRARDCR